ncbi:hypothetical protein JCM10449v2_000636 [Rhodotorula kratochvilovae]
MDAYLDPSLAGALAFLDPAAALHQATDPASLGVPAAPLAAFDYDQWINPQATVAYHAQSVPAVLPHPANPPALAHRDVLAPPPTHPFGTLHSEPAGVAPRVPAAALSSLSGAVPHAADPLNLGYGAGDFAHELFEAGGGSSAEAARAAALPHGYPSQPAMSLDARRHDLVVPDVSSYSIAAYGDATAGSPASRRVSAESLVVAPSPARRSPPKVYAVKDSASAARSAGTSSGTHTPKTPQADESVPEAALHLLRLAQPDGSATGSVATNSTGTREDDASCDEDAEGESDDTSIHSVDAAAAHAKRPLAPVVAQQGQLETRVWLHNPDQPPLHVQRGGGPGSGHPSVSESVASTRTGRPAAGSVARTQREASVVSGRSRAVSDAASTASVAQQVAAPPPPPRRTSGRVRKPRLSTSAAADVSSDMDDDEHEYRPEDGEADAAEDSDGGRGGSKRKGKSPAAKGKKTAKRPSTAAAQGGAPSKKARTTRASSSGSGALQPRKPRRQAYIPANLQHRTFPAHVEISDMFPRFYRTFPVSSAFAPDSYVLKQPKQAGASSQAGLVASTSTATSAHFLPTLNLYDESAFAAAQFYAGAHTPIPSTSASSLSNISVDTNSQYAAMGYLPMASPSAYSPPGTALPHQQHHPHAAHPAMSPALSATSSLAATPFSSQASASTPPSTAASTMSACSAAATPTTLGPNGVSVMLPPPDAKWNKGGDPLNLYWPRFVKGNADDKCGMCPICAEPKERGGESEQKWLKLKNSSYVYHMSYTHGLSNLTGLPFSPPVEMRTVDLPPSTKDQRAQMVEGKCHKCNDWIKLLSVKNIDAIVPELIWWKHAKKCHGQTTIAGEGDPYQEDEVYALILQRKAEHGGDA